MAGCDTCITGTTCHVGNRKMYQKRKHGIVHHVDQTKKPTHCLSVSSEFKGWSPNFSLLSNFSLVNYYAPENISKPEVL